MVAEDFSVYGGRVPSLLLILGTRNLAQGHRVGEPHRRTSTSTKRRCPWASAPS